VRGTYNAIQVVGDAVGDTLFYGRGAGQMPTASAVVSDIIDMAVGRAQRTFQTLKLWSGNNQSLTFRAKAGVPSRFYLRLLVEDRPGVLAEVARILGEHLISIRSVIQHEPIDEAATTVPLIIMTHYALTGVFQQAVTEIQRLPQVLAPGVYYSVAD
jgi:homoserine dehydrogenase